MSGTPHDPALVKQLCERVHAGEAKTHLQAETNISTTTIVKYYRAWCREQGIQENHSVHNHRPVRVDLPRSPPAPSKEPLLMFLDIETLPNQGLFFDTYSERAIPLDFIVKPKSICVIGFKFSNEKEVTVLVTAEAYNDKDILEQVLPEMEKPDYIIWHFGEGFDRKFLEGRLFANGLPPLPPTASIDTYKLAKNKWGKTLNSNKLDHLAKLCGVPGKTKTDASLWVRCAQGNIEAMEEMALYNRNDVLVLEAVYNKLKGNIKSKINHNLKHDDAVLRCNTCGSTDLTLKGHELTAQTLRHRWQCGACKNWTPSKQVKQ